MIDVLFEQRIVQNTGLAAEAIWQAVFEAFEDTGRSRGVPFGLVFLVAPLCFHQRTAQSLATKARPGSLYKALAEDREITLGLQTRMEALSSRTLDALSIGFHTGLLRMDQDATRQILPGRKSISIEHVTDDVRTILNAAKRVGQAFAEMNVVQLSAHLQVRF